MKKLLAAFLIAWLATPIQIIAWTKNGTVYTTDGSFSDVQSAEADMSPGDSIYLPAGTDGWTAQITFDQDNITVYGAGTNSTKIQDDRTGSTRLMYFTGAAPHVYGFTVENGSNTSDRGQPLLGMGPDANDFLLHDMHLLSSYDRPTYFFAQRGVFYESSIVTDAEQFGYFQFRSISDKGDTAWSNGVTPGSSNMVFLEDLVCTNRTSGNRNGWDGDRGFRVCFRYSTINTHVTTHGLETSVPNRSGQWWEIYEVSFTGNSVAQEVVDLRGGSAYIHNCTFVDTTDYPYIIRGNDHRTAEDFSSTDWNMGSPGPYGADGVNSWDDNGGSNPLWTGTAGSVGTGSVTISPSPGWTDDQWIGDGVANILVNDDDADGSDDFAIITDSDADTIFYRARKSGGYLPIAVNDNLRIREVTRTMDGVGYTGGDLIARGTPAYPNHTLTPVRAWDNSYDDMSTIDSSRFANSSYSNIKFGTHVIFSAPVSYTAYTYPHPTRHDAGNVGSISSTTVDATGATVTVGN